MTLRPIGRLSQAVPTLEGAGARLRRAFGFGKTADYDPFLLLDDFRSDVPGDYPAGFPWHPHRGIETITYVLAGERRSRRHPGPRRLCRSRGRPVDDGGERDHPSGDAAGDVSQVGAEETAAGSGRTTGDVSGAARISSNQGERLESPGA